MSRLLGYALVAGAGAFVGILAYVWLYGEPVITVVEGVCV